MWRGKGGLQSSILYRFKWIMKSNVHIASKFLQVRCNLQDGHLEQSLSQIKSSYHYWCGDYALKKSNAVTVQGERDLELSPSSSAGWLGTNWVSHPQFTYCQDRNHHSYCIYLRDISDSRIKYVSVKTFASEVLKDCGIGTKNLVTCFSAGPALSLGQEQREESLKRGLQYLCFCVSTCPWVYNTPSPPLSCSSGTSVTHWCGWNLIEKWATVCIVITELSKSMKSVWKNQDFKNECWGFLLVFFGGLVFFSFSAVYFSSSVCVHVTCVRWCWDFWYE